MIACIGTRDPGAMPSYFGNYMAAILELGPTAPIVTGAARGCDQTAAELGARSGNTVHLVLPWWSYEAGWVAGLRLAYPAAKIYVKVYDPNVHQTWTQSVRDHHPAVHTLSRGAWALHARNFGIIEACTEVYALPSTKIGGGGTGQALRIAQRLGKKITNFNPNANW